MVVAETLGMDPVNVLFCRNRETNPLEKKKLGIVPLSMLFCNDKVVSLVKPDKPAGIELVRPKPGSANVDKFVR